MGFVIGFICGGCLGALIMAVFTGGSKPKN